MCVCGCEAVCVCVCVCVSAVSADRRTSHNTFVHDAELLKKKDFTLFSIVGFEMLTKLIPRRGGRNVGPYSFFFLFLLADLTHECPGGGG